MIVFVSLLSAACMTILDINFLPHIGLFVCNDHNVASIECPEPHTISTNVKEN